MFITGIERALIRQDSKEFRAKMKDCILPSKFSSGDAIAADDIGIDTFIHTVSLWISMAILILELETIIPPSCEDS